MKTIDEVNQYYGITHTKMCQMFGDFYAPVDVELYKKSVEDYSLSGKKYQLSDSIKELYGICSREKGPSEKYRCQCLENGWKGTRCEHWNPFPVSSYEELGEYQQNVFKRMKF